MSSDTFILPVSLASGLENAEQGREIVLHIVGKVVRKDANEVEIEKSSIEVETENQADKAMRQMTGEPQVGSDTADDGDEDDF